MAEENNNKWAITTFATVILALGAGGWFQTKAQSEMMLLLDRFQKERLEAVDSFQKERVVALDTLLQKELEKEAQLVVAQFSLAERDSKNRHEQQQTQIDEIKSWFKPPHLRVDGALNQK